MMMHATDGGVQMYSTVGCRGMCETGGHCCLSLACGASAEAMCGAMCGDIYFVCCCDHALPECALPQVLCKRERRCDRLAALPQPPAHTLARCCCASGNKRLNGHIKGFLGVLFSECECSAPPSCRDPRFKQAGQCQRKQLCNALLSACILTFVPLPTCGDGMKPWRAESRPAKQQ
jgi:hypothetical protein